MASDLSLDCLSMSLKRVDRLIRGSFFMFVESGCISTNIEFTVP